MISKCKLYNLIKEEGQSRTCGTDPEILPIAIATPDNPACRQAGIEHFLFYRTLSTTREQDPG